MGHIPLLIMILIAITIKSLATAMVLTAAIMAVKKKIPDPLLAVIGWVLLAKSAMAFVLLCVPQLGHYSGIPHHAINDAGNALHVVLIILVGIALGYPTRRRAVSWLAVGVGLGMVSTLAFLYAARDYRDSAWIISFLSSPIGILSQAVCAFGALRMAGASEKEIRMTVFLALPMTLLCLVITYFNLQ